MSMASAAEFTPASWPVALKRPRTNASATSSDIRSVTSRKLGTTSVVTGLLLTWYVPAGTTAVLYHGYVVSIVVSTPDGSPPRSSSLTVTDLSRLAMLSVGRPPDQ